MKIKKLLGIAFAFGILVACKKEKTIIEETVIEKTDPLELLNDSLSYTINGVKFTQKRTEGRSSSLMNAEANVKLDSLVNRKEYTSGDKDSVMFGRGFEFSDEKRNSTYISFVKKYGRNQAQPKSNQTFLFVPLEKLDLFAVGERKYALDYSRNNSLNGVLLELGGEYYGLQTNSYPSLAYHQPIDPALQSNSSFEITNLQKLKSGKYIIEAKFNAAVYQGDGTNVKHIENGYLRLKINPANTYF